MAKKSEITPKVRRVIKELVKITDEYVYLVDAYSHGQSETGKSLEKRFEKVLGKLNTI